jgi:hypothetical protein
VKPARRTRGKGLALRVNARVCRLLVSRRSSRVAIPPQRPHHHRGVWRAYPHTLAARSRPDRPNRDSDSGDELESHGFRPVPSVIFVPATLGLGCRLRPTHARLSAFGNPRKSTATADRCRSLPHNDPVAPVRGPEKIPTPPVRRGLPGPPPRPFSESAARGTAAPGAARSSVRVRCREPARAQRERNGGGGEPGARVPAEPVAGVRGGDVDAVVRRGRLPLRQPLAGYQGLARLQPAPGRRARRRQGPRRQRRLPRRHALRRAPALGRAPRRRRAEPRRLRLGLARRHAPRPRAPALGGEIPTPRLLIFSLLY